MAIDVPTLDGFKWSPTTPYVPTEEGEDGWCVRDAFCALFGWEHSSDEWLRFVQAPEGQDTPRLAEYLGLTLFEVPKDWNELIHRHSHPGIAVFAFPAYQMSHAVYVHDVQWLLHHWTHDGQPIRPGDRPLLSYGWRLGKQHMDRGPVLFAVIVDERQPPRVP